MVEIDFPEESVKQAREIVRKLKNFGRRKRELGARIYDGCFFHISYGFDESLKTGNCGRYFHEITKNADCFTLTGVLYLLAREAGLQPEIYFATDMIDVGEGENKVDGGAAHSFITIKTGKKTVLDDPCMGAWGDVKFFPGKNELTFLRDRKITTRHYTSLEKISEEKYLRILEEHRRPGGGRVALSATQRVKSDESSVFVNFNPETSQLKSSTHHHCYPFYPEPYEKAIILELKTPVDEKGNFDFAKGAYSAYSVFGVGWESHIMPQLSYEFPVANAEKVWKIFGAIIAQKRKSPAERMMACRLKRELSHSGLNNYFETKPNSDAERILRESQLEEALREVREWQAEICSDYASRAREDEVTYRCLLRAALYGKKVDTAKTEKNPRGYVFTEDEHHHFLEAAFEEFKLGTKRLMEMIIAETFVKTGLKPGSIYHANRKTETSSGQYDERIKYFTAMCSAHKSSMPEIFHSLADFALFAGQIDIEKIPVSELECQLSQDEIINGSKRQLFAFLINLHQYRNAMFLKKYQPGLRRILKA